MSTIQVNASWAALSAGSKVTVDSVEYTIGTDAFADIQSAVNASSTTEATTIMVADGTYAGDVVFQAAVTPQKADITIKAVGGNAVINGEVILGYRKQGVGAAEWTSGVVLDGFTLNQPADGSPCVTVQYIKSFEMKNCVVNGDGTNKTIFAESQSICYSLKITDCKMDDAYVRLQGTPVANTTITGGVYTNTKVDFAGSNTGTSTVSGVTFNTTLTDAKVGDPADPASAPSFYAIRTNGQDIDISSCEFNVDSTLTDANADGKGEWNVIWGRNAQDGASINITNCEVNFSDNALNAADLVFVRNTDNSGQTGESVSITDLASTDNTASELLAKTAGDLTVEQNGMALTYTDGVNTTASGLDANGNFIITDLASLKAFRDAVNAGNTFKGKQVLLLTDIDLTGEEWLPIGNSSAKFQGNFDGNGHTISNLVINGGSKSDQGFFGFTSDGSVKNINFHNAQVSGRLDVGVVSGTPYTTKFSNIKLTGLIQVNGMAYVGGAFGKNAYANIDNITIDAADGSYVKAYSVENGTAYRTYVGGVIGFAGEGGHKFSNITSNIDVYGSTIDVGGIIGIAHYGNTLENINCSGNVVITHPAELGDVMETGGIAGVWNNGGAQVNLNNCVFTGSLTVQDGNGAVNETWTEAIQNNTLTGAAYSAEGTGKLGIGYDVALPNDLEISGENTSFNFGGDRIESHTLSIADGASATLTGDVVMTDGATLEIIDSEVSGKNLYLKATVNFTITDDMVSEVDQYVNVLFKRVGTNEGTTEKNVLVKAGEKTGSFEIDLYADGDYTLVVQNNEGGFTTGSCVVKNGKIVMKNGDLTLESLMGAGAGSIIMDVDSSLTAKEITGKVASGTGYIDGPNINLEIAETALADGVDDKDVYKLIDVTGDDALQTGNIKVNGNAFANETKIGKYNLVQIENDLYLVDDVKFNRSTLYVDKAFELTGEVVDGKLVGYNAFGTVSAAIRVAETLGGATIDLIDEAYSGKNIGETAPNGLFQQNGTYTFINGNYADFVYVDTPRPTAENAGQVDVNIVFDNAKAVVNKFRLDNGASLTINNSHVDANNVTPSRGWTTFYGDSTISITNSVVGWDIYDRGNSDHITAGDKTTVYAQASDQAGAMVFAGSGVMTVTDSTIFAYTTEDNNFSAYSVYDKGLMSFVNSAVYGRTLRVGVANGNKTVGRDDEVAAMVFDNSVLRNINGDKDPRIFVGDGGSTAGKLIIKNNSVINYSGAAMTVNTNGITEINGSTLNIGSVTNDGTFNVSGESTIKIDKMNGTVTALDGATLTDSTIGGGFANNYVEQNGYKYVLSVNGDEAGTLNLAGENTLQSLDAAAGDTVNISGKLHFGQDGDGFKLGNGATWNIENAEVDGAWSLSLDGYKNSNDAASTMNVKKSVFNLRNISAKGAATIGKGAYNVKFEDSDVNLGDRFQIQAQETADVNFEFTEDSTLAADRFINASSKGSVVFDNSSAEFRKSFGNVGTVTVQNGATLTATYADAALGTEKGNGNSGTINVNNATLSLTGSTQTAFSNTGEINVSDSAFTAASVDNSGTFNVSGNSRLNINLSKGYVTALDGTELTDSTIISEADALSVAGKLTFRGENEVSKIAAFDGTEIIVGSDASLKLSGARSGFGNGSTWDIDGNIVDAKAVTDKTALTVSLDAVNGLSMSTTNGADSKMTVDNAYVIFGGSGVTSKNTNNAGGKYTMSFNNSIVDFNNNFGTHPAKDSTITNLPVFDIDFKNSVVTEKSNLLNADGHSTMTFDNSIITVGSSFRNDGTFELLNGSEMTVNSYIQESSGNAGMYGTFKMDSSSAKFVTSSSGHQMINRGTISMANGSSFEIGFLTNAGEITIDNSTFTAGTLTNDNDITVSDGGSLTVDSLTNSANITLCAESVLNVNKSFANYSSITIDVSDYTGSGFKAVDFASGVNFSSFGEIRVLYDVDNIDYYTVISKDDYDISIVREADYIFVKSTYDENTVGYGYDHFKTYDDALEYLIWNDAYSYTTTMVIEDGTHTLSYKHGGTSDILQEFVGKGIAGLDVEVRSGATLKAEIQLNQDGEAVKVLDLPYNITVKAGGKFISTESELKAYVYDSALTIGEANSTEQAIMDFAGDLQIKAKDDSDSTNIKEAGALVINNAKVSVSGLELFGNVTMDIDSCLAFADISGTGKITIDTTGFTSGTIKVLDYTGTGSVDYSAFVENSDNFKVIGGDLFLTSASADKLYVNDAWINKEDGYITSDGRIVGYNAFGSLEKLCANYDSFEKRNIGAKEIVFESNVTTDTTGKLFLYSEDNITFSAAEGKEVVIDATSAGRIYFMDTVVKTGDAVTGDITGFDAMTVTIGKGVTLKAALVMVGQSVDNDGTDNIDVDANGNATRDAGAANLIVEGTVAGRVTVCNFSTVTVKESGKLLKGSEALIVRSNGTLTVNGDDDGSVRQTETQFTYNYIVQHGGKVVLNNTTAAGGLVSLSEDTESAICDITAAVLELNNSKLTLTDLNVNDTNAKVMIDGSDLTANKITNAGSISVSNSTLTAGTLTNSNIINIADSTLTVTDKLTLNGGYLNVSGSSKITAANGGGYGYWVCVADDTTLTDSVIASEYVALKGDLTVVGGLTVDGFWTGQDTSTTVGRDVNDRVAENPLVIKGDAITVNGSMLLMHDYYDLQADVNASYIYFSFGSNVAVNSTVSSTETTWVRGTTNVNEKLTANAVVIGDADTTGTLNVAGTLEAGTVTVNDADDTLNVNAGTLTASNITNAGTINVSGESEINANITGTGKLVFDKAVLTGNITGSADAVIKDVDDVVGLTIAGSGTSVNVNSLEINQYSSLRDGAKLDVAGKVDAKSYLSVKNGAELTAGSFDGTLYVTDAKANIEEDLVTKQMTLYAGTAEVSAKNLSVSGTTNIEAGTKLLVDETFDAEGSVNIKGGTVEAGTLNVNGGTFRVKGNLTADEINNSSKLHIYNGASVEAGTYTGAVEVGVGPSDDVATSGASIKVGTLNLEDMTLDKASTAEIGTWNNQSGSVAHIKGGSTLTAGTINNAAAASAYGTAGKINVAGAKLTADSVVNNGTFNISGQSEVDIAALTGNAINALDGAVLTDSAIGGKVQAYGNVTVKNSTITTLQAGYGTPSEDVDTTMTLDGAKVGTMYVGDESVSESYKAVVSGSLSEIGSIYARTGSELEIKTDLNVTHYWQQKGSAVIDGAEVTHSYVNFYIYNNDSDALASLKLTNGAVLNATGLANNVGLVIGNTESSPAKGHGALYLEGGSTADLSELQLRDTVDGKYTIELKASDSTLKVADRLIIGDGALAEFANSTLTAGAITNDGFISVVGENNKLTANKIAGSGDVVFGYTGKDADGKWIAYNGNTTLTLDTASLQATNFRMINTTVDFARDTDIEVYGTMTDGKYLTSTYVRNQDSTWNLNGNTVNVYGMFVGDGFTLNGGALNVSSNARPDGTVISGMSTICFQGAENTIAADAEFNVLSTGMLSIYSDLVVNGKVTADKTGNGTLIGHNDHDYTSGATLTVNGSFTQKQKGVTIYGGVYDYIGDAAKGEAGLIDESKLVVNGSFTLDENAVTNYGEMDVNGTLNAAVNNAGQLTFMLEDYKDQKVNVKVVINHSSEGTMYPETIEFSNVAVNKYGLVSINHTFADPKSMIIYVNGTRISAEIESTVANNVGRMLVSGTVTGDITNNGALIIDGDNAVINGAISGKGFVQVADGKLTTNGAITASSLVVGQAGTHDNLGDMTLVSKLEAAAGDSAQLIVKDSVRLSDTNAYQQIYVGYADGTAANIKATDPKFTLTVDEGGYIKAADNASRVEFHVGNSGKILIQNGGTIWVNSQSKVRGELDVTGSGSQLVIEKDVNVYGEDTGSVDNASITISNGAKAWIETLLIGKNSLRTGVVTIDNATLYDWSAGTITVTAGSELKVLNDGRISGFAEINNAGTITITDSNISADSISNTGTGVINITITSGKVDALANINTSGYSLITQTVTASAALDLDNVNIKVFDPKTASYVTFSAIGDTHAIGDFNYTLSNGDGNDLQLQILPTKFYLGESHVAGTPGYGVNKFDKFAGSSTSLFSRMRQYEDKTFEVVVDSDVTGPSQWFVEATSSAQNPYFDNKVVFNSDAVGVKRTITVTDVCNLYSLRNSGELEIGKDVELKFTGDNSTYLGNGYAPGKGITSTMTIDGKVSAYNLLVRRDGVINVNAGGEFQVEGGSLLIDGKVNLNGSADQVAVLDITSARWYNGTMTANNADIDVAGYVDVLYNSAHSYDKSFNIALTNSDMTANSLNLNNGDNWNGNAPVADFDANMSMDNSQLTVNSLNLGGDFTAANNSEITAKNVDINSYGFVKVEDSSMDVVNLTNNGKVDISNGIFTADKVVNTGSQFDIANSTVKINKLDNDAAIFLSGTNTIQVEDATGSGYAVRANDGVVLENSYIKAGDNMTLRMLGSLTVEGGFSTAYLQGAPVDRDGVGGTFTIADNSTVNVSYGVEFSHNYTLNGGKIVLSGGRTDGVGDDPRQKIWGFVFQSGKFDINTDIEVNGIIDGVGMYAPVHFTGAQAILRSELIQYKGADSHDENGILIRDSQLTVDGGKLHSDLGVYVERDYDGNGNRTGGPATLTVENGSITGGKLVVHDEGSVAEFNNANVNVGKVIVEKQGLLKLNSATANLTTEKLTVSADAAIKATGSANNNPTILLNGVNTTSVINGTVTGRATLKLDANNDKLNSQTVTINGNAQFGNIQVRRGNKLIVNGTLDTQKDINYHLYNWGNVEINGPSYNGDSVYLYGDKNAADQGVLSLNGTTADVTYLVMGRYGIDDGVESPYTSATLNLNDADLTLSRLLYSTEFADDSKHRINLTNGSTLTINNDASKALPGNTVDGISAVGVMNVDNSTVTVNGNFVNNGLINVSSGSTFSADTVANDNKLQITGSTLTADEITGAGQLYVNGASTINADAITGGTLRLRLGQSYDESGNTRPGALHNITYSVASSDVLFFNLYDSIFTMTGATGFTYHQAQSFISDTTFRFTDSAADKTLTFTAADSGWLVFDGDVTFESGTYNVNGGLTIQDKGYDEKVGTLVSDGAKLNVTATGTGNDKFHIYENLTVAKGGEVVFTGRTGMNNALIGYHGDGYSNGAVLTVEGIYRQSGVGMVIDSAHTDTDPVKSESALVVKNNGSFVLTGGTLTNNGFIKVESGTLQLTDVTFTAAAGATTVIDDYAKLTSVVMEGVNVTGSGYIEAENSTFKNSKFENQVLSVIDSIVDGVSLTGNSGYVVSGGYYDDAWNYEPASTTTVQNVVNANTWYNYGNLVITENADFTVGYYGDTRLGNTVIKAGAEFNAVTYRGYNGLVEAGAAINASGALNLYGIVPANGEAASFTINGSAVVKHNEPMDVNLYIGFRSTTEIGGARTVVTVDGADAELKALNGSHSTAKAEICIDDQGNQATLNVQNGATFLVEGKLTNNGLINVSNAVMDIAKATLVSGTGAKITVSGKSTLNGAFADALTLTASDLVLMTASGFSADALSHDLVFGTSNGKSFNFAEADAAAKIEFSDGVANEADSIVNIGEVDFAKGDLFSADLAGTVNIENFNVDLTGISGTANFDLAKGVDQINSIKFGSDTIAWEALADGFENVGTNGKLVYDAATETLSYQLLDSGYFQHGMNGDDYVLTEMTGGKSYYGGRDLTQTTAELMTLRNSTLKLETASSADFFGGERITNNSRYVSTLNETNVTVASGSAGKTGWIVAGNRINGGMFTSSGAYSTLVIDADAAFGKAWIVGGQYLQKGSMNIMGDSSVTINAGTFTGTGALIGGSHVYDGTAQISGNSYVTINGGTFGAASGNKFNIYGSGYNRATADAYTHIGNSYITINGGTFNATTNIYGGIGVHNQGLQLQATVKGDTNILISGEKATVINGNIYAGSFDRGVIEGNTTITLSNGANLTIKKALDGDSSNAEYYKTELVTGNRRLVFDNFGEAALGANAIRNFDEVVVGSGSKVTVGAINLDEVSFWRFDEGDSLSGFGSCDLAGDTLALHMDSAVSGDWTIMTSANAMTLDDTLNVIDGDNPGYSLTWNNGSYIGTMSDGIKYELKLSEDKKSLVLAKA